MSAGGQLRLDAIKGVLSGAIQDILETKKSSLSYEELYRMAYTMVFSHEGHQLYESFERTVVQHLRLVKEEMYKACQSPPGLFLKTLLDSWDDFNVKLGMAEQILLSLDRVYMKHHAEKNKDYKSVQDLALAVFRDEVVAFRPVLDTMKHSMLEIVMQNERRGCKTMQADWVVMRKACQMLIKLGLGDGRIVYVDYFEHTFLARVALEYRAEGNRLLKQGSAIALLKDAENRMIAHERNGCCEGKTCLDSGTETRMCGLVLEEMVGRNMKHIVEMKDGMAYMLEKNMRDELSRMYTLFEKCREPSVGLQAMQACLAAHFLAQCIGVVGYMAGQQYVPRSPPLEPVAFIQSLIDIKDKFEELTDQVTDVEKRAIFAILLKYVNMNPKTPEYLSAYMADKMKKLVLFARDVDIEDMLSEAAGMLDVLKEKDVFYEYYKHSLARRLLQPNPIEDMERMLLDKMLSAMDPKSVDTGFVHHLTTMIKDITFSEQMSTEFAKEMAERETEFARVNRKFLHTMELRVRVLTNGFWPGNTTKGEKARVSTVTLPREMKDAFNIFADENGWLRKHSKYHRTYNRRLLTLQPNLGTVDIEAVFLRPEEGGRGSDATAEPQGKRRRLHVDGGRPVLVSRLVALGRIQTVAAAQDSEPWEGRTYLLSGSTSQAILLSMFNLKKPPGFPSAEREYLAKLKQMQKYIAPLRLMIANHKAPLTITDQEDEDRLRKTKNLLKALEKPECRYLPLATIGKCDDWLKTLILPAIHTEATDGGPSSLDQMLEEAVNAEQKDQMVTYEEMQKMTGMPEPDLQRALRPLCLGKGNQRVLVKTPESKTFLPTDTFVVNEDFRSPTYKVRLQQLTSKAAEDVVKEKVDESRKLEVTSCLVRIMKSRKELSHGRLVAEVVEQLRHRFLPQPQLIKQRVEMLIEEQYLKRCDEDKKLYMYVA